jgi:peptidoglycan-N-acetylglucosamine deacetylase
MRVALTFDAELAGHVADPGNAARILDALSGAGARTTFFLEGRWTGAHPDLAQRIADGGHLIGNHSYHHAPMSMMTAQGIEQTVLKAEARIGALTCTDPKPYFRLPYGDGEDDPRVLEQLENLGYVHVGWDLEVNDWLDDRVATELTDDIVQGCAEFGDGVRVLLHAWPDVTAEVLPGVLQRLRDAGATFVGVDEL